MSDTLELFSIPSNCPVCSHPLSIEGDFLYCRFKRCPTRLFGDVKVWVDRLGLLFWGDALISSLTDPDKPNSIKSIVDLYRLSIADIEEHCSGAKMARKCWKVLHDNLSIPLEVVLAGLNIPNLGLATATDIVKAGHDTLIQVASLTTEQLLAIPNIGEVTARQIRDGLDLKSDMLVDLDKVLSIQRPISGPLTGRKVCITGDVWAPRKAVQKMIVAAGGQAVDNVSKDTSLLVCDDAGSSSSKSKRAAAYGIPMIGGADLKKILDGLVAVDEFCGRE
jgi:DNA ligase (NAD+)